MVFYFTCSNKTYIVYMGRDKFENEELIKFGWREDIWFHVDGLSSAHVYIRPPEPETFNTICSFYHMFIIFFSFSPTFSNFLYSSNNRQRPREGALGMLPTGQAQLDSRLQGKRSNDSLHAMVQFEKDS